MTLVEAARQVSAATPFITRKSWSVISFDRPIHLVIQPTNSPDRCIYYGATEFGHPGWAPTKDDLLADDWFPIKSLH